MDANDLGNCDVVDWLHVKPPRCRLAPPAGSLSASAARTARRAPWAGQPATSLHACAACVRLDSPAGASAPKTEPSRLGHSRWIDVVVQHPRSPQAPALPQDARAQAVASSGFTCICMQMLRPCATNDTQACVAGGRLVPPALPCPVDGVDGVYTVTSSHHQLLP